MGLLRTEPVDVIATVPQLVALAGALARQVIALYSGLGKRMAELGNESARTTFAHIESIQREHARDLPEWDTGEAPAVFHGEDLDKTRLVTPYMAYSLAVRNEERAFAFWSYVSAHARDPRVQTEAERLAHAEMDHVRVLRAERRRAYRERGRSGSVAEPPPIASIADFRREAARREAALSNLHGRIATALDGAGDGFAAELAAIAHEESEIAREFGGAAETADGPALPADDPGGLLAMATEALEATVELYLAVAEQSQREEVIAAAQTLACDGIGRLSRLR